MCVMYKDRGMLRRGEDTENEPLENKQNRIRNWGVLFKIITSHPE